MKKRLVWLLCGALLLSGCSRRETPGQTAPSGNAGYADPFAQYQQDYDTLSWAIYEYALGDYYSAYQQAKEATSVSVRYAMMAIAEAKLMEAAVMLPLSSNGGEYAISRAAPYTSTQVLWGNDRYRFHDLLVTTKPITAAHRQQLKDQWAQLKGSGQYEDWARGFLLEQGYTIKDTHTLSYSSDPQTWDGLSTAKSANTRAIVNTYDGLYEYDGEGMLQPALAQSYEVSTQEGTGFVTYTFHLRPDVYWVDSQGRQVAPVKADDFVAGMQHMMDTAGGLEDLVEGIIVGAADYINKRTEDFSQVGVQAIDDTTLVYTLSWNCPYFMTMLGYSVFAPMSREFYQSKGGKFGAQFNAGDPGYLYGTGPEHIAYCGPYVVTNATARNTIVFQANPAYWNADNINLKTITWLYNDGEDPLKAYSDTMSGVLDGASLTAPAVEKAKSDGVFQQLVYITEGGSTSFMAFYNLNRSCFVNSNDGISAPSTKDSHQAQRSMAAMRSAAFRRALSFAADRAAYNAQSVGEELKLASLRNSLTPGDFVTLPEEATVVIGGSAVTYPEGTYYGKIMQDQLDADNVGITVWDEQTRSGDGFDGWYDPEAAMAQLTIAIGELEQQGVQVSPQEPIYLELPYFSGSESYSNRANAYKKSVEAALGGNVVIRLVECVNSDAWYYAGYFINGGDQANFDIYDVSGWGPDFGDPQTYLDTFLPDYAGYMTMMMGIF